MKAAHRDLVVQVVIGLFLILIGILLNLKSSNEVPVEDKDGPPVRHLRSQGWVEIVHHVGTAILTCGMLMVTVEFYTKYREARSHSRIRLEQERYIAQLRDAQSDALLIGLLPDKTIFEQIKSEIIQQPFIRRNMKAIVHLRWVDDTRTAIRKVLSLSYDVENTSTISGKASIRTRLALESPTDEESRVECLEITSRDERLNIRVPGNETPISVEGGITKVFTNIDLVKYGIVRREKNELQAHLEVELGSKQSAHISYKQKTLELPSDDCRILCTLPTIGFELHINPDSGISVQHAFLHPSGRVLRVDENITDVKIDGAILPYQGIEFNWTPTETTSLEKGTGIELLASSEVNPKNPAT